LERLAQADRFGKAPEVSQQPTETLATTDDEETEKPNLLARLGVVGTTRLVVGSLGLGGFVLGAIISWHSASATTLLIVSAVMLLLAALGLDWNKIRGTYGGWTVELLRDIGTRIEQVAVASAATEEVPVEIRDELESLRAEVKALTPPSRPRLALPASPSPNVNMEGLVRELMTTKANHTFRGTEAVQLSLRIASFTDRFSCTVKTLSGGSYAAVTRRPINVGIGVGVKSYGVIYPDEFPGSEPLLPGRYEVEWREAPLVDPANALASLLAQAVGPPVATDSFTIPDTTAGATRAESQRGE